MKKKPNPRLVKIHRSYTVDEVARVCGVHKNTVRRWIKLGLETVDSSRPTLILGAVLRAYLETLRTKNRKKLKPGEIYCVKCRDAKTPFDSEADLEVRSQSIINLVGLCEDCESVIYRRVSMLKWRESMGHLRVTVPEALEQLVNGNDPSLNCDLM